MILATIRGVTVTQKDDRSIEWISGAAIDADGSNGQAGNRFAYRYPGNDGLDDLADAGWPHGSWCDILFDSGNGTPLTDGNGNAYSQTAYWWPGNPIPTRYLDATSVPYVVVNPIVRRHALGVVLGCGAEVSYRGKTISCVVGDISGPGDIGEISIAAAKLLGIPSSPRAGGANSSVTFRLFPGGEPVIEGVTYRLIPATV